MPADPGESLLTTLFADVHYYFSNPSSKPPHHRFDRGSYVYLFHNADQHQAKLEIANHAGTPDQDAFHGYLDAASVRHSHLQPSVVTLSVDSNAVPDNITWHLPSYNLGNEQKYMYKLHSLDIYLWTEKDAGTFIGYLKKILRPDRLDIKGASGVGTAHAEHRDLMSPVVQQLERTAVGTPYQQRTASTVSAHSIPGPPTPAGSAGGSPHAAQAAPMAYNPAAPAAPEPIAHREKTPPPPNAGTGTGLHAAVKYDQAPSSQSPFASTLDLYQNSNQTTPRQAYFGGAQQVGQSSSSQTNLPRPSSSMAPPPPQQRAPSFGPMAPSTLPQSPPPDRQSFQHSSTFGGPPGQTQFANYNPQQQYSTHAGTSGYGSPLPSTPSTIPSYAGHTPMQSPGLPPPPPPPPQQQLPIGGYSRYDYSAAQAQPDTNTHGAYTGDLHNQAYRPTEAEQSVHKPKRSDTGSVEGKPFGNIEGKVGKYLNKLDKLW